MSEEYLKIPSDYGGILAGELLEKIEKAKVTDEEQTVIVLVGCTASYMIGTVVIPKPNSLTHESERIEAEYTDKTIQRHIKECVNQDPDHDVSIIIRRLTPERKQNGPAEASNLAFLFKKMLGDSEV